jgi:fatty acid desaturase
VKINGSTLEFANSRWTIDVSPQGDKSMASRTEYIPGVCNIGPAEIGRRRRAGWIGAAATVALWAILWIFKVPAQWRLFLFFPASMAATGFLQSALHFCAGFGMRGIFNFGPVVGLTESVEQTEFRRKDRAKARLIALYSALIGAVVALLGFFLVVPPLG